MWSKIFFRNIVGYSGSWQAAGSVITMLICCRLLTATLQRCSLLISVTARLCLLMSIAGFQRVFITIFAAIPSSNCAGKVEWKNCSLLLQETWRLLLCQRQLSKLTVNTLMMTILHEFADSAWRRSITSGTRYNKPLSPGSAAVSIWWQEGFGNVEQIGYPAVVKNLFLHHNAVLPALVERLFSFAGMMTRPHHRSWSKTFEQLLILKAIEWQQIFHVANRGMNSVW